MAPAIQPHRARYAILDRTGRLAGNEDIVVERDPLGTRIRSRIRTAYPVAFEAEVDWLLLPGLETRVLEIRSRVDEADTYEIELAVTGNGLLAHRSGGDGPTQVELGWGPGVALDYISAAFPAVMVARAGLPEVASRRVDVVQLRVEDLVPEVLQRELASLGPAVNDRTATDVQGPGTAFRVETGVVATGHRAELVIDACGALRSYEGLLRLESLTLLAAPTK